MSYYAQETLHSSCVATRLHVRKRAIGGGMVRLSDSLSGEDNMNKYLMLSAAAVLASTAAQAGTFQHSFTFGTSGGSPYCDGGNVYTSGATVWSWQHTNNNCASGVSYGQGLLEKSGTYGKGANMSDNYYGKNYGIFTTYLNYNLPKKLANGKPWELFVGFNGTSSFFGNSGVLTNVAAAKRGGKSTTAGLKMLLQVHKENHN